jgi:hypothetical protein
VGDHLLGENPPRIVAHVVFENAPQQVTILRQAEADREGEKVAEGVRIHDPSLFLLRSGHGCRPPRELSRAGFQPTYEHGRLLILATVAPALAFCLLLAPRQQSVRVGFGEHELDDDTAGRVPPRDSAGLPDLDEKLVGLAHQPFLRTYYQRVNGCET